MTDAQTEAQTAGRDLVARFEAAWNAHDMAAFAELFHPDATFVNRYGMYWRGRDRVVAQHAAIHATVYRDSTLSNTTEDVDVIGPEVALVHMHSVMHAGAAHPAGPHEDETRALLVVSREDGAWRIKAGHNATISAPPSPPKANA